MGKHVEDVDEIKEILTVVSEKVPALLNQLADVLYGKDRAQQYGKAVATFYKELRDAGMSEEKAFELTQEYMSAMNLGKLMGGKGGIPGMAGGHMHGDEDFNPDEFANEINKKIKYKIENRMRQPEDKGKESSEKDEDKDEDEKGN